VETEQNGFTVVLHEGMVSAKPIQAQTGNTALDRIVNAPDTRGIELGNREFTVHFETHVAIAIRDEMLVREENQTLNERFFGVCTDSFFLDFVRRSMAVDDDHPGPISHYVILTWDHIFDVASLYGPIIAVGGRSATADFTHPKKADPAPR
ncbi:MAG: hypothetical protein AAGJ70_12640, partial [Pseudomonadota bacterium]